MAEKCDQNCTLRDQQARSRQTRYRQESWVNELRGCIEQISGYPETSRCHWILVQLARVLHRAMKRRYVPPCILAHVAWVTFQLLSGFLSSGPWAANADQRYPDDRQHLADERYPDDEDIISSLESYLAAITSHMGSGSNNADFDFDALKMQLYRVPGFHIPRSHAPRSHAPRFDAPRFGKYLYGGVMSGYPTMPGRRNLNKLAGVMLLGDLYDRGYYTDIRALWRLVENDERVTISQRVPRAVALQYRAMALFAEGSPEDMLSLCILHAWERLGRTLLRKCKCTQGLTDVFDRLACTVGAEKFPGGAK